ncbi:MAG: regulatory iron-sulfur-containing complex subunit RicT [Phycisphaerales bacterium]
MAAARASAARRCWLSRTPAARTIRSTGGRVPRVATVEDLNCWPGARARFGKEEPVGRAGGHAGEAGLRMKVVEVEPVLAAEHVTVDYLSEERVDFREMVPVLARRFIARVEMGSTGKAATRRRVHHRRLREMRQYCCCKNFLKVLKPVSMKSAKTQKASLDPLKITAAARPTCCLRYEDQTYEEPGRSACPA